MNEQQLAALAAELTDNPLGVDYSNDVTAAEALNAQNRAGLQPISSQELLAWAGANARFVKLLNASNDHPADTIRSVAWAARTMVERDQTTLDLRKPDRAAMVAALVSGGVLQQSDVDDLYSRAAATISRAEELGLPVVTPSDVAHARAMQ